MRAGGHEKIEEPLRSHDDLANVVAGAAVIMSEKLATGAAQIVSGDQFMGTFFAPRVVPDIPGGNAMPEDLAYAHLMASMRRRNGSDGSGGSNPNDRGLCW